jgi:hypothetical protein
LVQVTSYDVGGGIADTGGRAVPLPLAAADCAMNQDVITMEFSDTHSVSRPDGPSEMRFRPAHRKGNIISFYRSDFPETVPTHSLDLSFPALRGASGAPIIVERTGVVVGMIVANIERHLMPAQVERIESPDGTAEDRRYFLPVGKAISWRHLREFIGVHEPELDNDSGPAGSGR